MFQSSTCKVSGGSHILRSAQKRNGGSSRRGEAVTARNPDPLINTSGTLATRGRLRIRVQPSSPNPIVVHESHGSHSDDQRFWVLAPARGQ